MIEFENEINLTLIYKQICARKNFPFYVVKTNSFGK
jgi:hypothetical protein